MKAPLDFPKEKSKGALHLKSDFHYFSELCKNFELVSVYRTLVYIFHPCNLFRGNTVKEDCPYQRLLIVRQQEQGGIQLV